jgi:hypothetical protein
LGTDIYCRVLRQRARCPSTVSVARHAGRHTPGGRATSCNILINCKNLNHIRLIENKNPRVGNFWPGKRDNNECNRRPAWKPQAGEAGVWAAHPIVGHAVHIPVRAAPRHSTLHIRIRVRAFRHPALYHPPWWHTLVGVHSIVFFHQKRTGCVACIQVCLSHLCRLMSKLNACLALGTRAAPARITKQCRWPPRTPCMHAIIMHACKHAHSGPQRFGRPNSDRPPIFLVSSDFFSSSTALRIAPVTTCIATRRQDASHKPSDEDSLVQCN